MVCNNFQQTKARLARWLLLMRDRMDEDKFPMTQSFISIMFGVRREAVTKSVCNLQRQQLIIHHRKQDLLMLYT